MPIPDNLLKSRFQGCLLGLAVGDALGGKFEAQAAEAIRARFPTVSLLIDYPKEEIWYTDDTQMAIGIAETLAAHGRIIEEHLCNGEQRHLPGRRHRHHGRHGRSTFGCIPRNRSTAATAREFAGEQSQGAGLPGGACREAVRGLPAREACVDRLRINDPVHLMCFGPVRHLPAVEQAFHDDPRDRRGALPVLAV